jgi:phage tail sheath protein FI
VWPHPDWAGLTLTPAQSRVELLVSNSAPFGEGSDDWGQLTPDDFFDPFWSAAAEEPGNGITAFVGISTEVPPTQLVVPDLYLPAQWAGSEEVEALPPGTAGAEFSACVDAPATPAVADAPPSSLTGLILDPRTLAGLNAVADLQQRVLDVCEASQDLIALFDVPPGLSQARIETWRARFDSAWAAAYHPWLVPARRQDSALDTTLQRERRLGPAAVAAGIVARREAERGIQWGPANEIARSIIDSAEAEPEGRADALHPRGINCLVRDPDGLRLVAARTLSRQRDWRQLSVRRLVLMLRRTLLAQMQWAVFEPNGERLWRDLQLAIEGLLRQLFRAGAFAGSSEAESFFVRLLTERQRLDRGELVAEIGVAPAEPLEFILVRLRRDGDGSLNLEG